MSGCWSRPAGLSSGVTALMDREIAKGEAGRMLIKINSLTDINLIRKLREASPGGRQDRPHRPRHLLHTPRRAWRDGKHPRHKHRRALSGALAHLLLRRGRGRGDVHLLGGLHDPQHPPPRGGGLSDNRRRSAAQAARHSRRLPLRQRQGAPAPTRRQLRQPAPPRGTF